MPEYNVDAHFLPPGRIGSCHILVFLLRHLVFAQPEAAGQSHLDLGFLRRLAPYLERGWRLDDDIVPATLWTDDYVNVLSPLWNGLRGRR